ncbi:hypothetical protein BSAF29S_03631 [Bacillus safensis subsp. safensis]
MTNPIKIGIIDDQPLIRQGFRYIASAQEDINVIWEASDGQEAVELLDQHTRRTADGCTNAWNGWHHGNRAHFKKASRCKSCDSHDL